MKTTAPLRAVCAFLTVIMLLSCVSCAGEDVFTLGSHSISENEFKYYLATYKAKYAQTYSDFDDSAEFYSQQIDGRSAEDVLFDAIVHNVKMSLVCEYLFDEYRLKLDDSVESSIDAYISDFIDEYASGSKNAFNSALSTYGINARLLKQIYLRDEKATAVFNYLYGDNGEMAIDDGDREEYLTENYIRVRHIYVNNKYTYKYDEDGYPVYSSSGVQETEAMYGEELASKNALIAAIDEALAEGGSFEEIYSAMSEDAYYKNGYYLTRDTDFVSSVVSSAFSLEIGEWVKVESEYGTHYIMRLEMDEKPWEDEDNADFFENYDDTVSEAAFASFIEEKIPEVGEDASTLSEYSVEASATNYRF